MRYLAPNSSESISANSFISRLKDSSPAVYLALWASTQARFLSQMESLYASSLAEYLLLYLSFQASNSWFSTLEFSPLKEQRLMAATASSVRTKTSVFPIGKNYYQIGIINNRYKLEPWTYIILCLINKILDRHKGNLLEGIFYRINQYFYQLIILQLLNHSYFINKIFFQKQMDSKKANYSLRVPRTLVFNFDHVKQADTVGDPEQKGIQWAPRYYHILTPLKKDFHTMFRYDLQGYSYGEAQPLDIVWCGYTYPQNTEIYQGKVINRNKQWFEIENLKQYYKGDGILVLFFGPIKRYCNSFSLYYQGHYGNKYTLGLNQQEYKLIVTEQPNQLA